MCAGFALCRRQIVHCPAQKKDPGEPKFCRVVSLRKEGCGYHARGLATRHG
jgi:hypothetical protein